MPRYNDTYEQETLLTLNTRTGVKKKSPNYSSYWLDFDDARIGSSHDSEAFQSSDPERIVKLASVRRAVANFVRILTNNEKIEVTFSSGKDSYTDGKKVVIAAEDDSKHFDSMVGLALHEGSHCLLSDFNIGKHFLPKNMWWQAVLAFSPELRSLMHHNYSDDRTDNEFIKTRNQVEAFQKILGTLMNIIEDRRIDSFVYQNAGGYRPYYDAMYSKYFFNDDVTKNMKYNPDWRKPTVENYLTWLIHIFHPDFDRNALPGLSQIVNIIDLKNIRRFDADKRLPNEFHNFTFTSSDAPWVKYYADKGQKPHQYSEFGRNSYLLDYSTLPLLWRTANDTLYTIIQYVANYEQEMKQETGKEKEKDSVTIDMGGVDFDMKSDSLPNLDMNQSTITMTPKKFNQKKAESWMKKMEKVMKGENRRKKLKSNEKQDIENLENADAKLVETGDNIVGKFPCIVTRKMTRQIMESSVFPFTRNDYDYKKNTHNVRKDTNSEEAVVAGIRMGQILAHRLAVRNDPTITHFTRQEHGKIDRRVLAQLGMDIENVFKRTTVDNYKPVMIHLSLDASGSMGGGKWYRTMTVATALAYVASKINNVEVVITIRGDREIPMVAVIYDSRKDKFQKARSLFPLIFPNGSTPEGLCFSATLDLITECSGEYDVYFINFSDGEPGTSIRRKNEYKSYGGTTAYEHTRRQIRAMKEAGVKVLSYFITEYDVDRIQYTGAYRPFKMMYGEDAVFVNVKNVTEVLRTLNKLLIKKV